MGGTPDATPGAALAGLRVLDLSRVRAGPTVTRLLADFGADVVRIEPPKGLDPNENMLGDRDGPDFQNLNRNKRSLALNLKRDADRAAFLKLVDTADIVVENYRPGVIDRLGIGWDTLSALNPRLILGSVSGFGQTGPYAGRPGFDQIVQGMGGLMGVSGFPSTGPMRAGAAVADVSAGLYLTIGILLALEERHRSGRGQWVRSSLLHAMIAVIDFQAARYIQRGEIPPLSGNDHPTSQPASVYPSSDGLVNIACHGEGMWRAFCEAIERMDLFDDPRFARDPLRADNREALRAELSATLARQPTGHWVELLNRVGVACGPVYAMDQVFADPQVRHLGVVGHVEHARLGRLAVVTPPIVMSRTPYALTRAAPEVGEHSDAILKDIA